MAVFTINGSAKKLYIDDVQALKINDFVYFGEQSFNNYNIVIKNNNIELKREQLLNEYNIKTVIMGDITIDTQLDKILDNIEFRTN